jgi:transcriptional regulator with XRE-family HTH domain
MSPVNVNSIGSYIREQREQAKISLRQLAQAAGVSNPYLSQVERGLRRPSADLLQQIAKGLRISAEALYDQAGMLDDKVGETAVTDAIMADPEITERQKQMLVDIYESFRKEVRAGAEARAVAESQADQGKRVGPGTRPLPETEAGQAGPPAVAEAGAESGHDPVVEVVAAAEAEPWTDPPAVPTR